MDTKTLKNKTNVVIVGGGFGGLYTAQDLKNSSVDVTLIDKRNFHLFQPLLYQVATGGLSPADIASPLRLVLSQHKNTKVLLDHVIDLDPEKKEVILDDHEPIPYDTLILATGVSHHYFGNDQWETLAPGLKTIEDAIEIRRRIFMAFEAAEKETDPVKRQAWLTFVIVGGGPTGVELAGAIAEIAHGALAGDFRSIDPKEAKILLIEGLDRVLPPYPPELSAKAAEDLRHLGVTVQTQSMVTDINDHVVTVRQGEQIKQINSRTILWAAGVKASKMGKVLAERTGVELDRAGRVIVEPDLSIPGHSDIFVIGDLANFPHQGERPLPGVAPVAMQQGAYVAKLIKKRLQGESLPQFVYKDYGNMAVIGQNKAVVNLGFAKFSGFLAWFVWVWAHIYYLIEFDNKLVVMVQWGWNYFTRGRGARLVTGIGEGKRKDQLQQISPEATETATPVTR
ncbi:MULTISPECIES: NAD(P)/FAD-dependent oxidoreductase [Crocosphaera]|nr:MULTISPECIES: NAD(P)/FAD-dependent oxidoreductase [Crocosphaera]EHJ13291.1 NADH dehydrogenase [Crocosphaera watsonii WH 0003]MCH2243095.1 NAD(P)/FAD-dependent oxidoreductase [Crocosphaera sp.]NQZ64804.1 NAD(P)/FAD-dependent oxidoreductase [Crocosphaera sp.]CCQ53892.1 NADH dehydrogenase [Crocosphaera watsonii WH 0005]CCQ67695.1 NADH dehydrogenase [Crocosphaera watsonii WH 0402]